MATERREIVITPQPRATKAPKPIRAIAPNPAAASERLLGLVQASLEGDKAEDVVAIDLDGKSTIADYMVIATGRSTRQVAAMAEHLCERLKAAGIARVAVEGAERADWILIDGGDVIVHLFRPEVRAFYGLEKMWGVDLTRRPGTPHHTTASA